MENYKYYFNQFWGFYNPEVLRMGKLTNLLEKIYKEEFDAVPFQIENKLFIVGKNYEKRIKNGGEKTIDRI